MKKLIVTLTLICYSSLSLIAQWDKISGQKDILLGGGNSSFFGSSIAHHRNTSLIISSAESYPILYLSTDRGSNWRKLKMPNLISVSPTNEYGGNKIALNDSGICFLTSNENIYPRRNIIYYLHHTKDLGQSWKTDTIQTSIETACIAQLETNDKGFYFVIFNENQKSLISIHKLNTITSKWDIYYDFIAKNESYSNQFNSFNLSKNRFIYGKNNPNNGTSELYIRDLETKNLITTIFSTSALSANTSSLMCYTVDSIIVIRYSDFSTQKNMVAVSKDLGKTWLKKEINLSSFFSFNVTQLTSIRNNIIYILRTDMK
jgi:hypothetical protein